MPIRPEAQEMVDFLNSLVILDQKLISAIVNFRYIANEKILHHPTVQVKFENGAASCGMLGLLNGFFGAFDNGPNANWGAIYAVVELDGRVTSFGLLENK